MSDRLYGRIIAGCGVFLVCFGLWFLWTGLDAALSGVGRGT
jgi:hypothetical protein